MSATRVMASPDPVRRANERAVVRYLQGSGVASRAECAKAVGVSQPTVGKIVDRLLERGILEVVETTEEAAVGEGARKRMGRPGQMIRLDRSVPRLVLVQVGVEMTRVGVVPVGVTEEEAWGERFETPGSAEAWRGELERAAVAAARLPGAEGLWAVVVSVPGAVDEGAERVLLSPGLHWTEGVNLAEVCRSVWPGVPAVMVQEIRALALGQRRADEGSGIGDRGSGAGIPKGDDFLLVDFGSGVGAAAVVGGRLYSGAVALSGELGHAPVPGNRRACGCGAIGCVETLMSRKGLLRSYGEQLGRQDVGWGELVAHVSSRGVEGWLRGTLDATAAVIASALNVMGLRRVVLTGSVTELAGVSEYLSDGIASGAMWGRFGAVTCETAPRRRALGMVDVAMERVVLERAGL